MSSVGTVNDLENDCKDYDMTHYCLAGIDHSYITDKGKTYQMLCSKYALQ